MEQIIIKRGNTLIPLASKKTATSIKSATQNVALLGDDTLNIVVVSPFKLDFFIGDTTFVYGNIYKLNRLPKVKKNLRLSISASDYKTENNSVKRR